MSEVTVSKRSDTRDRIVRAAAELLAEGGREAVRPAYGYPAISGSGALATDPARSEEPAKMSSPPPLGTTKRTGEG